MNGAARNAQRLPRTDVDLFPVDSPVQYSVNAIDRLFVMIVAVRRSSQALSARDNELKGRDAADRVVPGEQKAHRERPETDGLVGRVDVETGPVEVCRRALPLAVCTKPLVRRTLRVTLLRRSSANDLARCCDLSYHLLAASPTVHFFRRAGNI